MNRAISIRFIIGGVLLSLCSGSAFADYVDLTSGGYGSFSSGSTTVYLDARATSVTVGTGVIDLFVRMDTCSQDCVTPATEQGYNTGGSPVPLDDKSGNFTTALQIGDLNTFTNPNGLSGTFYRFMLDINQTNSSPYLSLDAFQIYTSSTTGDYTGAVSGLGTPLFDLASASSCQASGSASCISNAKNGALLDYSLHSGSGKGEDMYFWLPTSVFSGLSSDTYLYLYSKFGFYGSGYRANDGFEEWAHAKIGTPGVVPEPGVLPLFGFGLLALLALGRRATRRSRISRRQV